VVGGCVCGQGVGIVRRQRTTPPRADVVITAPVLRRDLLIRDLRCAVYGECTPSRMRESLRLVLFASHV